MQSITFQVTGMSCDHCVHAIEKSVGSLEGIKEVEADLENGQVQVSFDSSKTSADSIKEKIEDQGYEAEQIVPFF